MGKQEIRKLNRLRFWVPRELAGGPGVKPGFAASDATVLFDYTTHPSGTRAGNPTRVSSLGPKRHHALDHASVTMWRGCRELNSDLKVRSLAPSSVGPHPHIGGGREI